MNSCREKSLKMIIFVLAIILTFDSTFVSCKNDVVDWDECTEILVELKKCSSKLHLPSCNSSNHKSELLLCAQNVTKDKYLCEDPIGLRIIKHYVNMYQHSDKILCQNDLHNKFRQNKQCSTVAKIVVTKIARFTPGSLSEKGCRVGKVAMYIHALSAIKPDCYELLKAYIDALYVKTSCAHVKVVTPTIDEFKDLRIIISHLITCWIVHSELPTCKDGDNKRIKCLEAVNISGVHNALVPLAHNFIEVSRETDKVICSSEKLTQEFNAKTDCWSYVKTVGLLILGQANGLLTADGCRAIQYRENITMAKFDQHCAKLLLDYRQSMDKILPCITAPSVSFAISLQTSGITFVTAVSVMILHAKSYFIFM
uniref:Uncharacterized protein n=1 Tax=Strigamia maritima TaxID=126957 RepID=T1J7A3_STRMM